MRPEENGYNLVTDDLLSTRHFFDNPILTEP